MTIRPTSIPSIPQSLRGMRVNREPVSGQPNMLAAMRGDQGDAPLDAFVIAMLATVRQWNGALVMEISRACTRPGGKLRTWRRVALSTCASPGRGGYMLKTASALIRCPGDPSRRDGIELHLDSAADLGRLDGLLVAAIAADA